MKYSRREVKDLFLSWFLISLAFAILFSGGLIGFKEIRLVSFVLVFGISLFTAGLGFLLHELMHKYLAQKYGLLAEFVAFYKWIWFALAASLFGFIFAAPGAVQIKGRITTEKNGKISLVGPATNLFLAIGFLIPLVFFDFSGILESFFSIGLQINALLAAFNMIPIAPFDGAKVLNWNKTIYFGFAAITLILFIGSYAI